MTRDSDLTLSVENVARGWQTNQYYDIAEKWTHIFWANDSVFRKLFDQLDLNSVVELACGHGRHAELIADLCGTLTLVDVHAENIEFCRQRLSRFTNVNYVVNEGFKFDTIDNESTSAIFSYDSMVHFNYDVVKSYVVDTYRILKPGGMAVYHHSNYPGPLGADYVRNPHGRNHMTFPLMCEFATNAGLTVVESIERMWGKEDKLDRVTLLRK